MSCLRTAGTVGHRDTVGCLHGFAASTQRHRAKARLIQHFNNDRTSSAVHRQHFSRFLGAYSAHPRRALKPKPKRHRWGLQHGSVHDARASDATRYHISYPAQFNHQTALLCSGRGASRLPSSTNGGRSAESASGTRFSSNWCALGNSTEPDDTVAAKFSAATKRCEERSAPLAPPSSPDAQRFAAHARHSLSRESAPGGSAIRESGRARLCACQQRWKLELSARARDANHGMAAGPLLASESLTDGIAPSNTWFDARASQLHVRAHSLTPARGGPRRQPAECSACPRDRSSLAHTSGYVLSRSICPCFDAHFHGPSRVLSLSLRQAAPPVPPSTT